VMTLDSKLNVHRSHKQGSILSRGSNLFFALHTQATKQWYCSNSSYNVNLNNDFPTNAKILNSQNFAPIIL